VVPVCDGIVLYEVQIRPIGEARDTGVPVRSVLGQICTRLPVIDLGPVTRYPRHVVWLDDLLDAVYDGSSIDDGPGTVWDAEETLDIDCWVHSYHYTRFLVRAHGPVTPPSHHTAARPSGTPPLPLHAPIAPPRPTRPKYA